MAIHINTECAVRTNKEVIAIGKVYGIIRRIQLVYWKTKVKN